MTEEERRERDRLDCESLTPDMRVVRERLFERERRRMAVAAYFAEMFKTLEWLRNAAVLLMFFAALLQAGGVPILQYLGMLGGP